jgi:hypothetical protein
MSRRVYARVLLRARGLTAACAGGPQMYTCIELPFRFGFQYRGGYDDPLELLTLCFDCFFLADCGLNFRTGCVPRGAPVS